MREYTIDNRSAGLKLFNFVQRIAPVIKNSDLFKIIRKGVITVNNKKVDFSYKLLENDEVILHLDEQYFMPLEKKMNFPVYNLDIVFENNDILVINKPRGVLIHSDGKEYKDNLVEYIKGYLFRKNEWNPDLPFTPTVCNRLDYNTSGLIVSAKNHNALKKITAQFRKRDTGKRYYTLIYGVPDRKFLLVSDINQKSGEDNMMVSDNTEIIMDIPEKDEFIASHPEKSAMVVTTVLSNNEVSLVEIELWTGRKHQIRCQLKHASYPVMGDFKYFSPQSVKVSNNYGMDGYFLHSYFLELEEYGSWKSKPDQRFLDMIHTLFPDEKIF